jgi:hypothetical protein
LPLSVCFTYLSKICIYNTNDGIHYRRVKDGQLIFDGKLEWNFEEKSITVSGKSAKRRDRKRLTLTKASFGANDTGGLDLWSDYKGFTESRKYQHAKIEMIVDQIYSIYKNRYGNPVWTSEKGARRIPAPLAVVDF